MNRLSNLISQARNGKRISDLMVPGAVSASPSALPVSTDPEASPLAHRLEFLDVLLRLERYRHQNAAPWLTELEELQKMLS